MPSVGLCVCLIAIVVVVWLIVVLYATIVSCFCPQRDIGARYGRGRYALVTGASCGIGLEVVRRLRKQHVPVVAVCLADGAADDLENELEEGKTEEESPSIVIRTDLSKREGLEEVFGRTAGLDVGFCVLCAGGGYANELEHVGSRTEWMESYLHTNVTQTIAIASHFYSRWIDSNARGGIVLMSSAMAIMPASHCELYCASKAALAAFASSLASTARSHNIDVLAMSPGAVVGTHFFDNVPRTDGSMVSLLRIVFATGQSVSSLVDAMFRCIGRWGVTVVDTGFVGVGVRVAAQLLGPNALATAAYIVIWGTHSLFGWFNDYVTLPPQTTSVAETDSERSLE